jgi:hypothetical protein
MSETLLPATRSFGYLALRINLLPPYPYKIRIGTTIAIKIKPRASAA